MNSRPRISSILACFIFSLMVLFGGHSIVFSADAIWNGGTGLWSLNTNWTPNAVPNGTYDVYIDGGKTGVTSTVTFDMDASITGLTLDANSTASNDKLIIGNGRVLTLTGAADVTNNGTIEMAASNANTYLVLGASTVVFSGTGEFVLDPGDNGQRSIISSNNVGYRLTNDTGHTIRGAGYIGAANLLLTNNGTITADNPSYALYVQPSGTSINTGTMQAINGASLQLVTQTFTNTGGTILADGTNSNVLLVNGATIFGGNLTTASGGVIATAGGQSGTLDGVTITSGSSFNGLNGSVTLLEHTITNQGTMTIAGVNANTLFTLNSATVTLMGGGTLVLDPGDNGQRSIINSNNNGYRLTNNAGHTIRGAGYVGINDLGLTNNGIIMADNSTYPLQILPSGSNLNNQGTLRATNGATLIVGNTNFTNLSGTTLTGGTYEVFANSTIKLPSATGIVTNASTILLDGVNSNIGRISDSLDALTPYFATNAAAGHFTIQNGRNFTTAGAFSNAGILTIGTGSTFNGNAGMFTNSGELQLRGGTFTSGSVQLTNTSTGNINGFGTVTPLLISNGGSIVADNGTLRVSQISGSGGTVQSNAGATLQIDSIAYAAYLTNSGNLALSSNGIQVYRDYQNANFGTGNSFNARANVTGGSIVGYQASQTIIGATAAGTNTWILDLGNVRGGTSTILNYQIANNSTAPITIRGAVQTAVNGGNITDGRLSGTGVTASNFGPLAQSGNSGNLGVTFNATSGGALTGQSIAVVSNFSNVAPQIINLNGAATALAVGNATPNTSPVNLGNFRVSGTLPSQGFTVQNTAPAVATSERLGIGSVSKSGNFSAANLLGSAFITAGTSQADAVSASVSGGVAGLNSGSLSIQYTTNGQLIESSFTTINANSQLINLQATGYNAAVGIATSPVQVVNQRTGASNTAEVSITNIAAPGSYSEDLNVTVGASTGAASGSGSISGRLAGTSNTGMGGILAAVDTVTAGAKTGTITLNYETAGSVAGASNGLGAASVGSQVVTVNGNVYQAAQGQINTPISLNFGTVQVGQTVQQTLSISNVATGSSGFVEDLNASFGGTSGTGANLIYGTGSIAGLIAGGTDSSSMVVHVDTAAAGSVNGAIGINYYTAGAVAGTSNGLGTSLVGTDSFGVIGTIETTGQVINQAVPVINTPTVALGNVRVNATSPVGYVSVTNQTTTAPQAALNASISTSAPLMATGSFNLLLPGATDNSSLQIGMNTSTAGSRNGIATVAFVSDASNVGGCGENCQMTLASQDVNVTGGVYQVAQPSIPATIDLGKFHVGTGYPTALSQSVIIGNTDISPVGYQEGLNVTANGTTGQATISGGPITNLAAGATSNAISVGLSGLAAGSNSGTATFALATNGATTSGLGVLAQGNATITVNGTGYNLAHANVIAPLNIVAHVGDGGGSISQALTISNIAPTGIYTEGLDSSFGIYTPGLGDTLAPTFSGSITNLAAGSIDSNSMQATISTATAGLFNGIVVVLQASNGATTSGLGTTPLDSQNVGISGSVTGGVFTYAQPTINNPLPIDFGNVRINTLSPDQNLSISNTAPVASTTELLNGSFISAPGGFTGSGNFNGLAPGAAPSTGIRVGIDTATAGHKEGNVLVNFVSDGTTIVGDGTITDLGNTSVAVQGNVYRLANPTLNTPTVTIAARVGDVAAVNTAVSITNTSPDIYTEGLKVNVTGTSGNAQSNSGSITNLVAQGTNNSTILVGLNSTATPGLTSGTVNLNFISAGAGTTGAADTAAQTPSGAVTVNGKVYTPAVASLSGAIDFGIVHVGDSVSTQQLAVQNAAAVTALNDVLQGTLTVSGPFTGGGNVGAGLGAGANQTFNIGLDTSAAGVFTAGTATFAGVSHNADMADLGLGNPMVELAAQINNYANPVFGKTSGDGLFSGGGLSFILNFGTVFQNSGTETAYLQILNDTLGPSDLLSGFFSSDSPDWVDFDFNYAGFNEFMDLEAGQSFGGLMLALNTTELGTFSEMIMLSALGYNASGYQQTFDIALMVQGNVVEASATPEPTTMLLLGLGLIGLVVIRRKIRK